MSSRRFGIVVVALLGGLLAVFFLAPSQSLPVAEPEQAAVVAPPAPQATPPTRPSAPVPAPSKMPAPDNQPYWPPEEPVLDLNEPVQEPDWAAVEAELEIQREEFSAFLSETAASLLTQCYQTMLKRAPPVDGIVTFHLLVDDGRLIDVSQTENEYFDDLFIICMEDQLIGLDSESDFNGTHKWPYLFLTNLDGTTHEWTEATPED